MPGYIEDRWYKQGPPDPDDPKKKPTRVPTKRHGQGMRYKVTGIPGVRSRSFPDKQLGAAKDWLANAQTDSGRGDWYDPRDGTMSLADYVNDYWWPTTRYPPSSKFNVRSRVFRHIVPHVGSLPLNRIGFDEIRAWQAKVNRSVDVGTLVVTWAHFSSILQAAHKAKRIPANPFRDPDLKPPRIPKSKAIAWPQETVAAVRDALPERYAVLLLLGLGAGLRQGEAFGFSPEDIDGEDIHVVRQVIKANGQFGFGPPKGNKERVAPCPPELAAAVKEYQNLFPTQEVTLPWVDPDRPNLAWEDRPKVTVKLLVTSRYSNTKRGGAVNRDSFNIRTWKPALVKAGLIDPPVVTPVEPKGGRRGWDKVAWSMPRHYGFHVLRHTFASVVLSEGEDIGKLADWLGHSDPGFTLRTYVHFMPKSGSRGREAIGRFMSAGAVKSPAAPDDPLELGSPQILPSENDLAVDGEE
ncbi:site-specific integrase [Streptomyces sp. NBC_00006]|uniref:tyrosine-type recombinase/integrase n=1 Tax=Streptomyces sp. NBC_00006 TaxID=2975619 RepID=UPI002251F06C|nr:site-specific integrase [Streptomyces sp. NBC_00006]MCX5529022.1 site-specific integrase [Streptomyces sp. NBC_00006]MCX5537746.1 site-specific integrase [Streptomyces sp. NBC_00006]